MADGGVRSATTLGRLPREAGRSRRDELVEAARGYLRRGFWPIPIPPGSKGPVIPGWQDLRLHERDLPDAFARAGNLGLLLGTASRDLVDVDLDCPEARELADGLLPPTPAESGRTKSPRSHRWYICPGIASTRHQDPLDRSCLLEIRSTGAQTLVGPSIHPSGDRYTRLEGEPARVDAAHLSEAVAAIAERIICMRHGESLPQAPIQPRAPSSQLNDAEHSPACVDRATILRRASAYLGRMPAAVSGQGGHARTYAAATVLVHGFSLTEAEALDLLQRQFNPRCNPPWSDRELQHKVADAITKPHHRPRGWLLTP